MRGRAEHEIHIEQLTIRAHVGVTKTERAQRQRLVLNLTVWPARNLLKVKDSVSRTVDYAVLSRETKAYLNLQSPKLLETLANDLSGHLLQKFPIRKIRLEVRKFVLKDAAYTSVTVTRRSPLD